MVIGSGRVYGRKHVIELVRSLMTREQQGGALRSRRCPILVVEGYRGVGKTALLADLVARLDQRVPHAQLDLETNNQVSVPQVLSALAFQLNRKCPRYGTLQFPRFIVGQLVMRLNLDLTDHRLARRQVVDVLQRHRGFDAISDVLQSLAGGVLDIMGKNFALPGRPPDSWLRLIVKWLAERFLGRRIVLGSFLGWYGHRDLGLSHDPVDVLVDLNHRAANSADEANQQWIDELLWTAFLADLRAEFGRRRWADERWLNCVVLLDNADTGLARRFLNQLVRVRRERAVGDQNYADPLTVVATSSGVLLNDVLSAHVADVPDPDRTMMVADNSRSGWLSHTSNWSRAWWLRYRLPDLTDAEVGRVITDIALTRGDNPLVTRVVYQLTGGHPASTRLALDAIARLPPQRWIEPETIIDQARPDAKSYYPPTVEGEMLSHLMGDVDPSTFRDLETCAAAEERELALALAGQDDLLMSGRASYGEDLDPILWPPDESAGPVLLRRLLRRRLARRDDADPLSWPKVYTELRRMCGARGDETGELYYALAEGDLGFVTRKLVQRLDELDSTAWAELLTSATKAPRRHRHQKVPIHELGTVVNSAELEKESRSVGRLAAALWIAVDPFTDSRRRKLHLQIAADYADVSRLYPGGPHTVFLDAEHQHRREAERWD